MNNAGLKVISEAAENEIIQLQNYFFQQSTLQPAITSVELSRLLPDHWLIIGNPELHSTCIKETINYTQIKLWAVITSNLDWENWKSLEKYVDGFLCFDPALVNYTGNKVCHKIVNLTEAQMWLKNCLAK